MSSYARRQGLLALGGRSRRLPSPPIRTGGFPFGYLILNTTDGGLKHHAGGLSWEVQIGARASVKVGFHGATPVAQRANANQAEATDLASVITLANELRAALVEKGLIKGES
jgi:hypothetical protein